MANVPTIIPTTRSAVLISNPMGEPFRINIDCGVVLEFFWGRPGSPCFLTTQLTRECQLCGGNSGYRPILNKSSIKDRVRPATRRSTWSSTMIDVGPGNGDNRPKKTLLCFQGRSGVPLIQNTSPQETALKNHHWSLCYATFLRRDVPISPNSPEPNSQPAAGTGTTTSPLRTAHTLSVAVLPLPI
jgi:hypothetical protein